MIKTVMLNSKEDILRLNNVATEQMFDLGVSAGNVMIDAKSLLALFAMIGKKVNLVVEDDVNPKLFAKAIERANLETV